MDKFRNYTDEELIDRLRDGETEITEYLINKYKNLVRSKAGAMFILGADHEDLLQEGMIGLFKAVRDYDSGRDAGFETFAGLCISRQMYTAIQSSGRKKHAPLNYYLSFYEKVGAGDGTEEPAKELGDILESLSGEGRNPEDMFIDRENVKELEIAIENELSSFERQVIDLARTGMGYLEIARILGREPKAVDNATQRIKMKLKRFISKKE